MFKFYLPYYNTNGEYKEFDLQLNNKEAIPDGPGILLKHQELIANMMRGATNTEALLLVHDMGTGKTCTAIGSIEKNLGDEIYGMEKAIVLNRGKAIMNNFINELVTKCTTKYNIVDNKKTQKKLWSKFYSFETFEIFSRKLSKMSDDQIIKSFNNVFLVIDEVHNILNDASSTYLQISRFISLIPRKKVLLLSGTPVKDVPEDFIPVINLILKQSERIDAKTFREIYYEKGEPNNKFKNLLKNKVSYLTSFSPNIKVNYVGDVMFGLRKFIITPHKMSNFQNQHYKNAYDKDMNSGGIYNNSRQAIRFVYPDGTYGNEGYNNYINDKKYTFKPTMISELEKYGTDFESKLRRISDFSEKYAFIIRAIIKADSLGQKSIVYDDLIKGSGLILFSMLLRFVGFKKHRLITSETTTNKEIIAIQQTFNMYTNGEKISVILGSKVIAEGFTFLDVLHEHLVPHWNNTETMQVVARGIRIGAHTNILKKNPNAEVNIYRHVSYGSDYRKSIDYLMTKLSEEKDIEINKIINVIKEVSITCNEFIKRNGGKCIQTKTNYDDYSNVISTGFFNETKIKKILTIFKSHKYCTLNEIHSFVADFERIELLKYLWKIVNDKVSFLNERGILCYLSNDRNYFFVTDNITSENNILLANYSDNVKPYNEDNDNNNFDNAINVEVFEINSNNNIQRLLELAATVKMLNIPVKNNSLVNDVLTKYKGSYTINYDSKSAYVWFLSDIANKKMPPTCLVNPISEKPWNEWKKCSRNITREIKEERLLQIRDFESNILDTGISYYGLWNPNINEFCIKAAEKDDIGDKRKIASGKRCTNWNKNALINIAQELNITDNWDEWYDNNRKTICDDMKTWFQQNNLLIENKSCGVQTKKK